MLAFQTWHKPEPTPINHIRCQRESMLCQQRDTRTESTTDERPKLGHQSPTSHSGLLEFCSLRSATDSLDTQRLSVASLQLILQSNESMSFYCCLLSSCSWPSLRHSWHPFTEHKASQNTLLFNHSSIGRVQLSAGAATTNLVSSEADSRRSV